MKEKIEKKLGWKELPLANFLEAGSSINFETGDWRSQKPIWDEKKCKNCLFCWIYCPDSAILVKDKKMTGIDYRYCKGCGICVTECPFKAIEMNPVRGSSLNGVKKEEKGK